MRYHAVKSQMMCSRPSQKLFVLDVDVDIVNELNDDKAAKSHKC